MMLDANIGSVPSPETKIRRMKKRKMMKRRESFGDIFANWRPRIEHGSPTPEKKALCVERTVNRNLMREKSPASDQDVTT